MPINANSWGAKRGNGGLLGGKSFVFLVMFVYWDPVSYKNGTGSLLAQTLIRVRCSDTRCSFVKPSSESIVAGALHVLLQFLAIWLSRCNWNISWERSSYIQNGLASGNYYKTVCLFEKSDPLGALV